MNFFENISDLGTNTIKLTYNWLSFLCWHKNSACGFSRISHPTKNAKGSKLALQNITHDHGGIYTVQQGQRFVDIQPHIGNSAFLRTSDRLPAIPSAHSFLRPLKVAASQFASTFQHRITSLIIIA